MTIKTFHRGGYGAGRGDQPHDYNTWHPSMGDPKTATGGGGKQPPKKPRTQTVEGGGGESPYGGMGKKKSGTGQGKKSGTGQGKKDNPYDYHGGQGGPMHPYHVLPQKKVSRDMHSQSDQIMKKDNVYNVPDSYWGNR